MNFKLRDGGKRARIIRSSQSFAGARGLGYAIENRFESEDAAKTWLARTKANFTAALDRDASNETALDYRGMTNERQRDYTAAIDDYTRLTKVNAKLGTIRLDA